MRRVASTIAIAAFLAAGPLYAFEAAGTDIIGLHLGMSESDVVAELAHQGYAMVRAPGWITSDTKDGRLRVVLSAEYGVTGITYVFSGRGVGGPAGVREAILTRFGNPDQATPPTWCRAVGRDGLCPADQATLTFWPESLTMRLAAGRLRAP
ncbi:hypothetical protein [Acidisphaera sp. S103]|uniref:hypothetical protein n=1 Tax=Acidisphaera sp. S103 TaxID=1747223 RepID=UPI00131C931C|nr:hypothetical protein [Acidisphaera sp. S103]